MATKEHAPLVLIGFNRPELVRRQLSIVRRYFRGQIFCVVDGPRPQVENEDVKVREVISEYQSLEDSFRLSVNISSYNLGCYRRIKSGIDWVFEQVEKAIILEDDCLPHPDFFSFSSNLLDLYFYAKHISSVSGTNLYPRLSPRGVNYFYSRYQNCWGWATWKKNWEQFIDDEEVWKKIRLSPEFRKQFSNLRSFLYWRYLFDLTFSGRIDSWFYRWLLTNWFYKHISVVPSVNLIVNAGGNETGTHTRDAVYFNQKTSSFVFNDKCSSAKFVNTIYDRELENTMYSKSFYRRLIWFCRRILKS